MHAIRFDATNTAGTGRSPKRHELVPRTSRCSPCITTFVPP